MIRRLLVLLTLIVLVWQAAPGLPAWAIRKIRPLLEKPEEPGQVPGPTLIPVSRPVPISRPRPPGIHSREEEVPEEETPDSEDLLEILEKTFGKGENR